MIYTLRGREPVIEGDEHFIAPCASIIGTVELKAGSSVWFGAVLRGDNDWIRLGCESNVQDNAVLHTDGGIELIVGDRVTVGHRATLHGCVVGDNTLIGIGSTVLNNARIGRNCVVGAHTLVTEGKSFPDGVLVMGSPARVVRELDDRELAMVERAADVYVAQSRRYRKELAVASD